MRRHAILSLSLVAFLALLGPRLALAQDGSPVASPAADGVTIETLYTATIPAGAVPDNPGGAAFLRFTLAPKTSFDFSPSCWVSPAADAWYVESGAFTIRPVAPAELVRAAAAGTAAEPVTAGREVTLLAGDLLLYTALPRVPGEFRNDGEEPVVGLVFGVWGDQVANCPPTGMVEPWLKYLEGRDWTLPPGPLVLMLRRFTLAPGASATFPASDAVDTTLVFDHIDEGSPSYAGEGAERMLRNDGDDLLIALALTLTTGAPAE